MASFIALAGIDGSGKTTLARELAVRLCETKRAVRLTYEPGGTLLGKKIRQLLLSTAQEHTISQPPRGMYRLDTETAWLATQPEPTAELLLFAAARAQHCARIRTWLSRGETIICDRFSLCTRAYQGAKGINDETLQTIERVATGGLTPQVTLLLDLDPELAQERLTMSGKVRDQFDSAQAEYIARVRNNYLREARHDRSIVVLDASLPFSQLADLAWHYLCAMLNTIEKGQPIMKVGRPSPLEPVIVATFRQWENEGRVIMPGDLAQETGAGVAAVRRVINVYHLWTPAHEYAMRQERARRVNASRRANGFASLQRQAAAGHPQLVAARRARHAARVHEEHRQLASE